jgi:hypothetical protein
VRFLSATSISHGSAGGDVCFVGTELESPPFRTERERMGHLVRFRLTAKS